MQQSDASSNDSSVGTEALALIGRLFLAVVIPLAAFAVLYLGFMFLRDSNAPKWVIVLVAIVWGVGGVALLYWVFNWLVEQLSDDWTARLQPYVFVGPAIAILIWYLALPTVRTFWLSLQNRNSTEFVGLQNYVAVFTERTMQIALRNNLLWIIFGATLSVLLGLIIAVLADRSRFERVSKAMIFMPMAISFVGAGVIWNFVYEVKPPNAPQIGLLNAIVVALGGEPKAWVALSAPQPFNWINNIFLIVIVVWLQVGFAMVLFSAALKGIPTEVLEASRVDGASEWQVFTRIMIPSIRGTIITVATTVIIFTLKIFDVVWVMTGGQFSTQVVATEFYRQYFTARNFGFGSAIAMVLFIAVIPVMFYNLRQFGERRAF